MLSDNFILDIPNVPTGASSVPLLMQCRTASKPGMTLNVVEVQVFGHTLEHASNITFSHDMQVEYVENRSVQIHTILEDWMILCRDPLTQHGAYKNEYSRDAFLRVFDQRGNRVKEYQIFGLWPSTVPETPFDGSASNLISVAIGYKYDYYLARA